MLQFFLKSIMILTSQISLCFVRTEIQVNGGGILSMAHWRFWLSPSPQLVFFIFYIFLILVLAYLLVM